MRKISISILLLSSIFLAGCSSNPESSSQNVFQLEEISVFKNPIKTIYNVGEYFDPRGMEIIGKFNDGDEKLLTRYEIVDIDKPLTIDIISMVITYFGFSTEVDIEVINPQEGIEAAFVVEDGKTEKIEFDVPDYWSNGASSFTFKEANATRNPDGKISGEGCIGDIVQNDYFELYFRSDKERTMNINLALANNVQIQFDSLFRTEFNEEVINTNITIKKGVNPAWYDFEAYSVTNLAVKSGLNVIKITKTGATGGGINLDYIEFVF